MHHHLGRLASHACFQPRVTLLRVGCGVNVILVLVAFGLGRLLRDTSNAALPVISGEAAAAHRSFDANTNYSPPTPHQRQGGRAPAGRKRANPAGRWQGAARARRSRPGFRLDFQ